MKKQIITYDPKKQGQQKGVSFLRNVYGFSYNKALSIYAKIRYQIAQTTDPSKIDAKSLDVFVTKAIYGDSKIKTKAIVNFTGDFRIKYGVEYDTSFKEEVARRLEGFKERYQNTYIGEYIDEYLAEGSKITYDELKREIEKFKQTNPVHLKGSE